MRHSCRKARWIAFQVLAWSGLLTFSGTAAATADSPDAPKAEEAAAVPATPAAPVIRQGVVTSTLLNVRARPARHYERIGQFVRGDRVTIISQRGDWLEVRVPNDTRAWIAAQFLRPDGTVIANNVRLHSGPGLVFTTFAKVAEGTVLKVMGPSVDGWQQVRAPENATAWVSSAYVRILEPEPVVVEEEESVVVEEEEPATDAVAEEDASGKVETASGTTGTESVSGARETTEEKQAAGKDGKDGKEDLANGDRQEDEPGSSVETPEANNTKPEAEQVQTSTTPAAEDTTTLQGQEISLDTTPKSGGNMPPAATALENQTTPKPATTANDAGQENATATPVAVLSEDDILVIDGTAPGPVKKSSTAPTPVEAGNIGMDVPPTDGPMALPDNENHTPAYVKKTAPAMPVSAALVMKEGILLSLKNQANAEASHVLCLRVHNTAYPVCYLKSTRIDLSEWEGRRVRLYGKEHSVPGWSRPVIDVCSIQIDLTP